MNMKRLSSIAIMTVLFFSLLTGCGKTMSTSSMDLSVLQTDISKITVPENVQVIGLGEASHGVKEYQQMKAEVFQALVNNNDCHTFIIEGDFGGALKVNSYIHGGGGKAEDIVREIGFAIYNTQEMVDLIEWMRLYNEKAPIGEKLFFYGMDIQRFDNNKEYLFSVLDKTIPELSEKYKDAFLQLTDKERLNLNADNLNKAKANVLALLEEMDTSKDDIAGIVGKENFDFAKECANTIYECCEVLMSSNMEYNTLRDNYMLEKIMWFMQREDGLIFINGHNGHIGKKSVSNYSCLGELLNNSIGEKYFAIGTDAVNTEFNSQNDDGGFTIMEVSNQNVLNNQLEDMDSNLYYVDFSKAVKAVEWQKVLGDQQKITSLNVGMAKWQKSLKKFYTTSIVPIDTFDGMIVFQNVSPTTLKVNNSFGDITVEE